MYSDVIWSVNIMIAILLVSVAVVIYYIFMYDTWYPNDEQGEDSGAGGTSATIIGETEGAH